MRAILAVAGVVLLTALVVLGLRGGGDPGDPTALDTPTGTASATDGSTGTAEDPDPIDPTEGSDEATPSPTDGPVSDDQTDASGDEATEPGDDATEPSDPADGQGEDGDSGEAEPAGSQSGDGGSGADSGGSESDDVDDMPDTGVPSILPLAGLALAGLALRLDR